MKRMMKVLMLFALVSFALLFNGSPAIAISLQTAQKIHVIHPEEGRVLALGQDFMTFKNTINPENPRDISLMVVTHPPQQGGAPLHKNPPEYFYIMSGQFEFFGSLPNDLLRVGPGDIVQVESNVPHGYKHIGSETGKMLVVTAPTWLQDYFEELGTPVKDKTTTSKPPSMEKTIAAGQKHEIEYLK